jgi:hypothetical protein
MDGDVSGTKCRAVSTVFVFGQTSQVVTAATARTPAATKAPVRMFSSDDWELAALRRFCQRPAFPDVGFVQDVEFPPA